MASGIFSNPLGAMEGTKNWSGLDNEYKAGAAITAGQLLSYQTDGSVIPTTTSVATGLTAGVANEAKSTGQLVSVRQFGLCYVASDTGVVAGDPLSRSGSNAGQVAGHATITAGATVGSAVQAVSADKSGFVLAHITVGVGIKVA